MFGGDDLRYFMLLLLASPRVIYMSVSVSTLFSVHVYISSVDSLCVWPRPAER